MRGPQIHQNLLNDYLNITYFSLSVPPKITKAASGLAVWIFFVPFHLVLFHTAPNQKL